MAAPVAEVIRNVAPPGGKMKRRVNAAAGNGRHQACRVADEENAVISEYAHRTAAGNKAASPFDNANGVQSPHPANALDQPFKVGFAIAGGSSANLHHAMPRHDPTDVTGCDPAVGNAMEKSSVDFFYRLAFHLKPGEEVPIAAEPKRLRHL